MGKVRLCFLDLFGIAAFLLFVENKGFADENPFYNRLAPAQQKEADQLYKLIEQDYRAQKFDMVLEKIQRLKQICREDTKPAPK